MKDKYIVKWQVKDLDNKYRYRYLKNIIIMAAVTDNRPLADDFIVTLRKEAALTIPEPVAQWLCQLLEEEGLYPEMEKI